MRQLQGTTTKSPESERPNRARDLFIALLVVSVNDLPYAQAAERPARRPQLNLVVILIDDLGWRDLGCFGSKFYETPHLYGRPRRESRCGPQDSGDGEQASEGAW